MEQTCFGPVRISWMVKLIWLTIISWVIKCFCPMTEGLWALVRILDIFNHRAFNLVYVDRLSLLTDQVESIVQHIWVLHV